MNVFARQFSGPSGPIGRLVTVLLARGNAGFNRWLVRELSAAVPSSETIVELGCGPGIALQELLHSYPNARVIGIDPSPVVLNSARRRNARAVADGRLTLLAGDVGAAAGHAPAGLVLAVHVVYFWPDTVRELRRVREILAPADHIALGYQLRPNMPPPARRYFPEAGFTLFDSDDQLAAVLQRAGFGAPDFRILGDPSRPGGRLALASTLQAGYQGRPGPRASGTQTARSARRTSCPDQHPVTFRGQASRLQAVS